LETILYFTTKPKGLYIFQGYPSLMIFPAGFSYETSCISKFLDKQERNKEELVRQATRRENWNPGQSLRGPG
jgi:hypothetical protein